MSAQRIPDDLVALRIRGIVEVLQRSYRALRSRGAKFADSPHPGRLVDYWAWTGEANSDGFGLR